VRKVIWSSMAASRDGAAAIDPHGRTGGERVGGEEHDRAGDILRLADPTRQADGAATFSNKALRFAASMPAHSGVSIRPGETALTRTGASSSARPRASDSNAALIAPCSTDVGDGRTLRKPETKVSEPCSVNFAARATR
jgi:hypothetical protein